MFKKILVNRTINLFNDVFIRMFIVQLQLDEKKTALRDFSIVQQWYYKKTFPEFLRATYCDLENLITFFLTL